MKWTWWKKLNPEPEVSEPTTLELLVAFVAKDMYANPDDWHETSAATGVYSRVVSYYNAKLDIKFWLTTSSISNLKEYHINDYKLSTRDGQDVLTVIGGIKRAEEAAEVDHQQRQLIEKIRLRHQAREVLGKFENNT